MENGKLKTMSSASILTTQFGSRASQIAFLVQHFQFSIFNFQLSQPNSQFGDNYANIRL